MVGSILPSEQQQNGPKMERKNQIKRLMFVCSEQLREVKENYALTVFLWLWLKIKFMLPFVVENVASFVF